MDFSPFPYASILVPIPKILKNVRAYGLGIEAKLNLSLTLSLPLSHVWSWGESLTVAVQSLSHVWLCNSGDCSTPGFPVLHYLPEFAQCNRYPYTKRNDNTIRFTVKNKGKCLLPINVSRSLTHYHAYSNESIKVSYFSPLFCRPESPALLFPSWELGSCTDVLASPSLDAWVCPITGLSASESCWLLGFSMYPSHPLLHLQPQFTQVWTVTASGPKINNIPSLLLIYLPFQKIFFKYLFMLT